MQADRSGSSGLGNLVDNALRHGGTQLELAAERADDRVELHVRDEGRDSRPSCSTRRSSASRAATPRAAAAARFGLAIADVIAEPMAARPGPQPPRRRGRRVDLGPARTVTECAV